MWSATWNQPRPERDRGFNGHDSGWIARTPPTGRCGGGAGVPGDAGLCAVSPISPRTGSVSALSFSAHRFHGFDGDLRAGCAGAGWLACAAPRGGRADRSGRSGWRWCSHTSPLHPVPPSRDGAVVRRVTGLHVGGVPGDAGAAQGAHRFGRMRQDRLDLPGSGHAGLGADQHDGDGHAGRAGELAFAPSLNWLKSPAQPSSRRKLSRYMRCSASISSTPTDSFTLWMLALVTPSSTTCAPMVAMKRPSEVPPPVDSFGGLPATACTAAHTPSDNAPGGV